MVLSNAEKQRAWRERHIWKRRTAHRIVNLLIRKQRTDKHVEQIADLLTELLNRHDVRVLRRRLKLHADPTDKDRKENAAYWHAQELLVRDAWLREHPGRTKAEYNRLLGDDVGEVWEWRWAKGRAINEAEQRAWEHDHPGEQFPEHECGRDRLARPQHRGARGLRPCCQPVDGACLYPDGARSLGGRCDRRTPLRGGWTHRRQLFAQFVVERGVNQSLGATSADAHGAQRHRGGGA